VSSYCGIDAASRETASETGLCVGHTTHGIDGWVRHATLVPDSRHVTGSSSGAPPLVVTGQLHPVPTVDKLVQTRRHAQRCAPAVCGRQPPQTTPVMLRFHAGRRVVIVAAHHGSRSVTVVDCVTLATW